jgi:hypothetical protein
VLCAWERTSVAARKWRGFAEVTETTLARAQSSATFSLSSGRDVEDATSGAADALRRLRLKVRSGPRLAAGGAGRWGLLGSPVFHWGLVALIVIIGAGRLTRSEGLMGVPVGTSVPDAAESYRGLDEGPLFSGHPDTTIEVTDLEFNYMTGDVDRGEAPEVVIRRGDDVIAEGRVYPNHPLRYGSTMIHTSDWGFAAGVSLEAPEGAQVASTTVLLDNVEGADRTTSEAFDLTTDADEAAVTVRTMYLLDEDDPTLLLTATDFETGETIAEETLLEGEALTLPSGERLVFDRYSLYSRLSVVHDWSVWPLYIAFVVTLAGLGVALFAPYRRVLAMATRAEGDGETRIDVLVMYGRGSSAVYEDRVRDEFEKAFGRGEDADGD